jgi:protein involved in polysaccharide export with SLBB domain
LTQTLVLPIRGLNIPFADVDLKEGDTVVVEPPRDQMVSVVGLVTRPGNMPYPPNGQYNLIQAIAFAGGLDLVADPRYISVYRLTAEGEIVSVTFQLIKTHPHHQPQLADCLALPLKPGDVVSVEQTPRTRMNIFLDRVFRITLGLYVDPIHGNY